MPLQGQRVRQGGKYYAVIEKRYKDMALPILMDWDDYQAVKNIEKAWKCHRNGFISCQHQHGGSMKEVFLHELVMVLKNQTDGKEGDDKPILHLNRIGLDNRRDNLEYKSNDLSARTTKKKRRTVKLPEGCNIDPDDIPTYVWYLKPHGTHGERFGVEIGNVKWKTTASKNVSLEDKLEDAKEYLRHLKQRQPNLFAERSMNGDYTAKGKKLAESYRTIVKKAGYNNILVNTDSKTDELLDN